jgi:hypothetical protein
MKGREEMYENLLNELESVVNEATWKETKHRAGTVEKRKGAQGIWEKGYIGKAGLDRLVKTGGLRKSDVFGIPPGIRIVDKYLTIAIPTWWDAVDDIWKTNKMWTKNNEPDYGAVMNRWFEIIKKEYGIIFVKGEKLLKGLIPQLKKFAKVVNAVTKEKRAEIGLATEWMSDKSLFGDPIELYEEEDKEDEKDYDLDSDEYKGKNEGEDEGEDFFIEGLTPIQRAKLPDSAFVFPDRRAWPIQSEKQARIAIRFIKQNRGKKSDYPAICTAIGKEYPDLKSSCRAAMSA